MGATRAVITICRPDGSKVFINDAKLAAEYLRTISSCEPAEPKAIQVPRVIANRAKAAVQQPVVHDISTPRERIPEEIPIPEEIVQLPKTQNVENVVQRQVVQQQNAPRYVDKSETQEVIEQTPPRASAGRWESLVDRFLRADLVRVADDVKEKRGLYLAEERIAAAASEGCWRPASMLQAGDVVRVIKEFRTADETVQVLLPDGCAGVVELIDDEGDALVAFPSLLGVMSCSRWVLKKSYDRLSVYHTARRDQAQPSDARDSNLGKAHAQDFCSASQQLGE